jgi:putative flippase GtrA
MIALVDWLPPAHVQLLAQMLQFGTVGVAGFLVDTAVVYATQDALGLYLAGTVAYGVAVTTTWWLNRVWTFRGLSNIGPAHRQWMRFAAANLPGLCLNLGTYFVLVSISTLCVLHPVIPIAAGAIAGMAVNFVLSRQMVFR